MSDAVFTVPGRFCKALGRLGAKIPKDAEPTEPAQVVEFETGPFGMNPAARSRVMLRWTDGVTSVLVSGYTPYWTTTRISGAVAACDLAKTKADDGYSVDVVTGFAVGAGSPRLWAVERLPFDARPGGHHGMMQPGDGDVVDGVRPAGYVTGGVFDPVRVADAVKLATGFLNAFEPPDIPRSVPRALHWHAHHSVVPGVPLLALSAFTPHADLSVYVLGLDTTSAPR